MDGGIALPLLLCAAFSDTTTLDGNFLTFSHRGARNSLTVNPISP